MHHLGEASRHSYKSDKFGLGFTSTTQKAVRRARAGGPPVKITNQGVNAVEDGEEDGILEDWIFPTVNGGLHNWEASQTKVSLCLTPKTYALQLVAAYLFHHHIEHQFHHLGTRSSLKFFKVFV